MMMNVVVGEYLQSNNNFLTWARMGLGRMDDCSSRLFDTVPYCLCVA